MPKPFPLILLGLLAFGTPASLPAKPAPPPLRIVLVGDSTVATFSKPPADRPDLTGWGQVISSFFTDRATILNHAVSGCSSKSFINEGHWQKALLDKPDYVFIQFGHNDAPGKGEKRTTDPVGNYRDYLRQYVDDARAIGARPIFVTSVARRTFANGKLIDSLAPYVHGMKAVATEKQVPLIDLHRASSELYLQLGEDGSADLTASASDLTHFSRKGALIMARMVAERIPGVEPRLAPCLQISLPQENTNGTTPGLPHRSQ